MAARASRLENQDAIDFAIVSMLSDPKEVESYCLPDLLKIFTRFSDSHQSTSFRKN